MAENFESGPKTPPELVKLNWGDKAIESSIMAYAAEHNQPDFDVSKMNTPEGKNLRTDWLLNNTENSAGINTEISGSIDYELGDLNIALRGGDREKALSRITRLKGLLDKLEQGVQSAQ